MAEDFPAGLVDVSPGAQMASYQLEEEIGRGGMAVVYRARDVRLGRWVALKVLAPDYAQDEAFRQRFIRESRTAAAVEHPNIIPIFDAGEASGVLYIAMRYVAGQDVHRLLQVAGRLPAARALGIVGQVAAALDAAHACGLVHRDVKPANMLLGGAGESGRADHVYLSDFGISKQLDAATSLTLTGQVLGTLNYLAPEQIEGRQVDGRADGYALACAAFEMLAGSAPFRRDGNMAVMWAQLNSPPPRLTSFRPDLPPAVDQVMARALAKSPAGRYPSCLMFSAALQDACGAALGGTAGPVPPPRAARAAPATAADPAPPPPPPARPPAPARPPTTPLPVLRPGGQRAGPPSRPGPGTRRRGMAAIVACLVILAAACAGYGIMRNSSFLNGTPAAAGSSPRTGAARPGTPAGTVRAYYAAISRHEYRRAWDLGGRYSGAGHTFGQFAASFGTTRTDAVAILGQAGNVVSARLAAVQTDGTVRHFLGKYRVRGGVIVTFQVVRTS